MMDEFVPVTAAFIIGLLVGGVALANIGHEVYHAQLCPVILAEATAADSLAVFQEHEGCFEFAQEETR